MKYLGSKLKLLERIEEVSEIVSRRRSLNFFDVFSGTGRVSRYMKGKGHSVLANDHNTYAYISAAGSLELNEPSEKIINLISYLNSLEPKHGFFSRVYSEESMFFQPKNAQKIQAIRDRIEELEVTPKEKNVLIHSLIEAADKVDNTAGVQMAYLKDWCSRSFKDLVLQVPVFISQGKRAGPSRAISLDALEAVKRYSHLFDVTYLDPPYNQHKYLSNYHIWETICLWDNPEVYGVAKKRISCREETNTFYSKKKALRGISELISEVRSKGVVISYNETSFVSKSEVLSEMANHFESVGSFDIVHPKYIGYKNLKDESSQESLTTEFLFWGKNRIDH